MKKLNSLDDLFMDGLKDVYNAEAQILKALPKMANAATAPQLQDAFLEHLDETKMQIERLEEVFAIFGAKAKGKKCMAMEGLIAEGKEIMQQDGEPATIDAALIAAAQKVEHYEIAAYGCLRTWAQLLDQQDAAQILQEILDEEKQTDERLTLLAEEVINEASAEEEGDETESEREEHYQETGRGNR